MTNQTDAYTLAAKAAADRARAEASHRASAPPGPGLQNPMRRLSKIPAVRWVLSGVLLAAGTALAVDYLNTPLRAWLQYQAKVPFINQGKSVAEVAAEQSAAPQADIEENIIKPAGDQVRMDAQHAEAKAFLDKEVNTGGRELRVAEDGVIFHQLGDQPSLGYIINGSAWESFDQIKQATGVALDTSTTLSRSQAIRPYLLYRKDSNPTPAAITAARPAIMPLHASGDSVQVVLVVVDTPDGRSEVGYISPRDYSRLDVKEPPSARTPPPIYGTFLTDPVLKDGQIYFKDVNGNVTTDDDWQSCTPASHGPSDLRFDCIYTGHVMANGKTYRVMVSSPSKG